MLIFYRCQFYLDVCKNKMQVDSLTFMLYFSKWVNILFYYLKFFIHLCVYFLREWLTENLSERFFVCVVQTKLFSITEILLLIRLYIFRFVIVTVIYLLFTPFQDIFFILQNMYRELSCFRVQYIIPIYNTRNRKVADETQVTGYKITTCCPELTVYSVKSTIKCVLIMQSQLHSFLPILY